MDGTSSIRRVARNCSPKMPSAQRKMPCEVTRRLLYYFKNSLIYYILKLLFFDNG